MYISLLRNFNQGNNLLLSRYDSTKPIADYVHHVSLIVGQTCKNTNIFLLHQVSVYCTQLHLHFLPLMFKALSMKLIGGRAAAKWILHKEHDRFPHIDWNPSQLLPHSS